MSLPAPERSETTYSDVPELTRAFEPHDQSAPLCATASVYVAPVATMSRFDANRSNQYADVRPIVAFVRELFSHQREATSSIFQISPPSVTT